AMEDFYNDENDQLIINSIFKVIKAEAPVQVDSVIKRITESWQMTKSGRKAVERIKKLMFRLEDHININENFVYMKDNKKIQLRVPGDERNIEEITIEELAAGITFTLQES